MITNQYQPAGRLVAFVLSALKLVQVLLPCRTHLSTFSFPAEKHFLPLAIPSRQNFANAPLLKLLSFSFPGLVMKFKRYFVLLALGIGACSQETAPPEVPFAVPSTTPIEGTYDCQIVSTSQVFLPGAGSTTTRQEAVTISKNGQNQIIATFGATGWAPTLTYNTANQGLNPHFYYPFAFTLNNGALDKDNHVGFTQGDSIFIRLYTRGSNQSNEQVGRGKRRP
ncbi:hypothetical protein [Hymenobacter negativus]|uniref:Uncharacterized protein n=1 Tax=Hymenobacter negativus TaxID=2795026 RepID=A0ABS0QB18_9BACT|nr:hypothetical protein [Hymenobacter negativus]MBH8559894.1 hypothetical protein [Hymenobacter negativus]